MFGLKPTCSLVAVLLMTVSTAANAAASHVADRTEYRAPKTAAPVIIDGNADDPVWQKAPWQELKH